MKEVRTDNISWWAILMFTLGVLLSSHELPAIHIYSYLRSNTEVVVH